MQLDLKTVPAERPRRNEKKRDRLLVAPGETGTRIVLRDRANSAQGISGAEFRTALDALFDSERSPTAEQSFETDFTATDSADRQWCCFFVSVHENAFCPT